MMSCLRSGCLPFAAERHVALYVSQRWSWASGSVIAVSCIDTVVVCSD